MRKSLGALAFVIIVIAAAPAAAFEAGVAARDITPDLARHKVPSAGYGDRGPAAMQGAHDPVLCQALVVKDGGGQAAIVTCDLIGVSNELRNMALDQVRDLGFSDHNFMITASHTHSGPGAMQKNFIAGLVFGRYNPELTRNTATLIAQAVREAHANLGPAEIRVGAAWLDDVTRNRRDPAGSYNYNTRRFSNAYDPNHPRNLVDPELTVISFDRPQGGTIAVIFNFASHPTVLGADNMLISADWPGAARRGIEAARPGATAMFINGAIGDQAPAMLEDGVSDFDYMEIIGARVAEAALEALAAAEPVVAEPVLGMMERRQVPPGEVVMGFRVPKSLVKYYFPEMPLQVVRMGDVALMGAPLEMVAEIGLALKAGARGQGVKRPVVAGLANATMLYCATPDDFEFGGYEVGNTIFGKIEAGLVIGELMLLVRKAWRE